MDSSGCLTATTGFGLLGVFLAYIYCRSPHLREVHGFQRMTLLLILLTGALTLMVTSKTSTGLDLYQKSLEGTFFLAASVCHLPVLVYILISQWNCLLEYLISPGSREEKPPRILSPKDEWRLVGQHREALRRDPVDPHHRRQLGEAYFRLGLLDAAIGEFRHAIECLDRGYEHAYLLFRTAHLQVDRKSDTQAALPLLRMTIRLYPRSYFASYARRIVNQYEARQLS